MAGGGLLAFYRRLGSIHFAVLSTLLTFTGSTLAYLVAWQWPEMVGSDPMIWSSLFLAPSAEWLFFNPWTPSLVVLAVGLYALTRLQEPNHIGWTLVAAVCFGHLFMFKSFAFPIVIAAVAIAATAVTVAEGAHRAVAVRGRGRLGGAGGAVDSGRRAVQPARESWRAAVD